MDATHRYATYPLHNITWHVFKLFWCYAQKHILNHIKVIYESGHNSQTALARLKHYIMLSVDQGKTLTKSTIMHFSVG